MLLQQRFESKQALRQAFDATMADAEFLTEAKQRGLEVNPVNGASIDQLIGELYATPAEIVTRVLRSRINELVSLPDLSCRWNGQNHQS